MPEYPHLSELPIELAIIGHYLGWSRNFTLPGQETKVSGVVDRFLSPDNQSWNSMMQPGGCFSMGNDWKEYVGNSKNLRILTACLCSGRMGLFVDTEGRKNTDMKKELKILLQSLDEYESDIFKNHIWPVIEPFLGRIIHTFQIHIIEDAIEKIRRIRDVVENVLKIQADALSKNMDEAKRNVDRVKPDSADTHIFFVDGNIPHPETAEPFSTSELIGVIRAKFKNAIIISNTNDTDFQKSHRAAGAYESANNNTETMTEILERIRIKRLFV